LADHVPDDVPERNFLLMRTTFRYGTGDVRVIDVPDPVLRQPGAGHHAAVHAGINQALKVLVRP